MKTKLLFLSALISIIFLFSCESSLEKKDDKKEKSVKREALVVVAKKETPKVSEITIAPASELLSKIDTSKIKTFDDYYNLKQKLFDEYYNLKQKSFDSYYNKKNSAFNDYYAKKQNALMVIREKHNAKYLEWLDAEKMNDYDKQRAIEISAEFAGYVSVEKTEYKKYEEIEKSSYVAYEQIEQRSYEEYARKEALACQAYQKKQ
jgi:hypothetical protein